MLADYLFMSELVVGFKFPRCSLSELFELFLFSDALLIINNYVWGAE